MSTQTQSPTLAAPARRFQMPSRRSLLDFALVLGGAVVATAAGFVLKVLIGRSLGDSALGVFAMCFATLTLTSTLGDVGIRYSLITLAARARTEDPEKARAVEAAGLLLKLLSGATVLVLGWLLAPWAAEALFRKPELAPYLKMASFGVFLWSLWDGLEGSLQASQRFRDAAALRILMEGARLVAFLALWLYRDGIMLSMDRFMWLYFLAPALAVTGGACLMSGSLKPERQHLALRTRELLSFAPGVAFYRTCTMVLLYLDSLALARYGVLGQLGRYEAAKGLAYAILLVSESLGMVLLPKVNQLQSLQALKGMLRRFAGYLSLVAVVALAWLSVAGPLLGLFGPAFTQPEVVRTFQILVLATLFTIPSTTISMVLLSLGQPGALGKVAAGQVLVGLVVFPFTAVQFGLVGAAATTAGLQCLGVLATALVLRGQIAGRATHPAFQPSEQDSPAPVA